MKLKIFAQKYIIIKNEMTKVILEILWILNLWVCTKNERQAFKRFIDIKKRTAYC